MFSKVPLSAFLVIVYGLNFVVSNNLDRNDKWQLNRSRRQASCQRNEFRCKNGQCISTYDKCDGAKQCSDGSDETAAACKASGLECPLRSFQCSYGACVGEKLKCDGKYDCADGSDEKRCPRPQLSFNKISSSNSCSNFEFQCSNGQCINGYDMCDGIKNCYDGSDESRSVCWDFECPSMSFKCSYGACLDLSKRCNGKADCIDGSDEAGGCPNRPPTRPPVTAVQRPSVSVANRPPVVANRPTTNVETRPPAPVYRPPPPTTTSTTTAPIPPSPTANSCKLPVHPKDGAYISMQCSSNDPRPACRNTPGTFVPSTWLLKYTCNSGFSLNKDTEFSICDNGVWQNTLDCIKLCPPLSSLSVNVRCFFGGAEINCTEPMKPDTHATAECKQHYKPAYLPEYSTLACLKNGVWSYPLFYCKPECGLSSTLEDTSSNSVPLILNGTPAKVGEFPWLTAIYRKSVYTNNFWDQQCGGTLITSHIVVTAAHCLVNNDLENIPLHPTEIRVGLGKYKRSYYANEQSSVISEVKEVVIPGQYSGQPSQYARDIGLLDLVVSVQVTATIMPACVDWFTAFVPSPNAEGVVAGWGRTEDGGASSEVALSARLKFIKYDECLRNLRVGNRLYLTHDKFCAGNIDGSQVNKGDSGGGLTFLKEGKHFLIGVVSTKIPGDSSFSLFLDITNKEHSAWLEREKNRMRQSHSET